MPSSINTAFDPESGFVVVQLEKETYGMPYTESVRYAGKVFQPKPELHITIVSREAADRVTAQLEQHPEAEGEVRQLIDHADWSYLKRDEFYHVAEPPDSETIIQMVEMPGLRDFFAGLEQLIGAELEQPPIHVTLYTYHTEKGIGLPTQAVFQDLVQGPVNLQDLQPAGGAEQGSQQHG